MFGLEFVKKLKPCKWRYKEPLDDGVEHFGLIAQEVDRIAPKEQYGFVSLGGDGVYLRLHLTEFIGPMVKAIQELEERLTRLEEQNGNPEKRKG